MAADSHTAAAVVRPCTGRIHHDQSVLKHIGEAVLADQQDQGGGRADDGLGAQTGTLALKLALQADQRRQAESDEQLDDLAGALTRTAEERRVGQPKMHATKLTRRPFGGDFRRAAKSVYATPYFRYRGGFP